MLVSVIVDLEMFLSKLILSCKLYFNLGQRFNLKYPSTKITGVSLPKMRLVAPLKVVIETFPKWQTPIQV